MFNTISTFVNLLLLLLFSVTTHAATYPLPTPGNDMVGQIIHYTVKAGDTLDKIANQHDIGIYQMLEANRHISNPYKLRVGETVIIPQQFILPTYRHGIVLNIAELRLYYFPKDKDVVMTYPVAMGREAWRTPTGSTRIVKKVENPTWHVPKSIREYTLTTTGKLLPESIPPGPDNPLGHYALYLGFSGYLIHGNNAPWTIGRLVSSGCIRMHNDAIESLFSMVDIGTPVTIVHHENKVGWYNGALYLESHAPISLDEAYNRMNIQPFDVAIYEAIQGKHIEINWNEAESVAKAQSGIPTMISFTHLSKQVDANTQAMK